MKFDIPMIYDEDYINFINVNDKNIHSIYFSLPNGKVSDARILSKNIDILELNNFLNLIPKHINKYITLNGRYTPFDLYSEDNIKSTMSNLKLLYDSNNLTGLIFVDFYYINLLSKIDTSFTKHLELVPSVNCYIDSIDKFYTYIRYIELLPFKSPSKIILDRSLNRNYIKLKDLVFKIKDYNSDIKTEILVNEGCMYQCPFKINHDICISLINDKSIGGVIYLNGKLSNNSFDFSHINQKYGCINYLLDAPEDILKSPFIRPEDIKHYDFIDVFKLCGKIRKLEYLSVTFNAYLSNKYNSNLLNLLDSLSIFNDKYFIFNDQITSDFFEKTAFCNKNCSSCNYCKFTFNLNTQILK